VLQAALFKKYISVRTIYLDVLYAIFKVTIGHFLQAALFEIYIYLLGPYMSTFYMRFFKVTKGHVLQCALVYKSKGVMMLCGHYVCDFVKFVGVDVLYIFSCLSNFQKSMATIFFYRVPLIFLPIHSLPPVPLLSSLVLSHSFSSNP